MPNDIDAVTAKLLQEWTKKIRRLPLEQRLRWLKAKTIKLGLQERHKELLKQVDRAIDDVKANTPSGAWAEAVITGGERVPAMPLSAVETPTPSGKPTRRPVPAIAKSLEDFLDRMSPIEALFYWYPPSHTVMPDGSRAGGRGHRHITPMETAEAYQAMLSSLAAGEKPDPRARDN